MLVNVISNFDENYLYTFINHHSNYNNLINVFAYVMRFVTNCKLKSRLNCSLGTKTIVNFNVLLPVLDHIKSLIL